MSASRDTWLSRLAAATFSASLLLLLATILLDALSALQRARSGISLSQAVGAPAFSIAFFTFSVVGFVIARRRPAHPIGWLLLGIGLSWGLRGFLFDSYLPWTLKTHTGSLPAAPLVGAISFPLWVPCVGLMGTFLILLFPDGRLPSPRWRPVAWASGITIGWLYITDLVWPGPVQQAPVPDLHNPLAIDALAPIQPALQALVLALPLCIVACAVALVRRFRRARGVERLQLKWLAVAGAMVAGSYLILMLVAGLAALISPGPAPWWVDAVSQVVVSAFALIPIAIGVAVLKHGLYGLDRLISRTVSYAVITGTLLVVYFGLVTAAGSLLPRGNSLGVAGATLVVAALFQPLRRRVQAAVDRRFNRSRYDAGRTVEAFSTRLRDEVDLESLRTDLVEVVRRTMEPSSVGVWLRTPGGVAR
ncbi:MAG: hypothetical protein ABJA34_13215 [Pseudonocardiales bacterium]